MRKRMWWLLTMLVGLLPLTSAMAAPAQWSALMEPETLAALRDSGAQPRIVRISGDYAAGHIPGAVEASYSSFRGPDNNPGALPDMASLTETVQSLGIDAGTPVVLVHQGNGPVDMGTATRVYWTLKSLGVPDLAVLNGGFNAWREAGLPVSTEAHTVAASDYQPEWRDDWRITTEELEQRIGSDRTRIVDARPPAYYQGEEASTARPGTIAGARNLSFTSWFDGNRMRSPQALQQLLAEQGPPQQQAGTTVSFCNTGHLASINWFVMSEVIGVSNTRLYAESMTEWAQADRPLDNEPGRLRHYWDMTVDWFSELGGS